MTEMLPTGIVNCQTKITRRQFTGRYNANSITIMDKYERRRLDFLDLKARIGFAAYRRMHEATGIDPSYLSRCAYPEGKAGKKRIGDDTVEKLDSAYPGWRKRDMQAIPSVTESEHDAKPLGAVPLISWVRAGEFCNAEDPMPPGDAEDWIPYRPRGASDQSYALRVDGDSMTSPYPGSRSYPEGILIIVDPQQEVLPGMRGIFKLPESDEATFKELVSDAGRQYLKPINPQYDKITVTDKMVSCGRVIGAFMPE